MSLHPSDDLLSAYLDGELTAAERGDVERMLAENSDGRQTLEDFRALGGELRSLPRHKLDADFAHRVLRKAERQMLETPSNAPAIAPLAPAPPTPATPAPAPRMSENDERPRPAPRPIGSAVGSGERDDEVRGARRLIRPVFWSLITIAAALAIMFFVDPGSRDRLARNVALDDFAAPGSTVSSRPPPAGGTPSEPRITARTNRDDGAGHAKFDPGTMARSREEAAASGGFARDRGPFGGESAGGMGGGGGYRGGSESDDFLAANAVYTVEVSAEAADLNSIETYFTGNRVAVVEDARTAEVTRGVLRKLAGLASAVDDTVVLQQADKRMLEQVKTAAGEAAAPDEVAYLVEGTPEQIAELVRATGAIPDPIELSGQSFDRDRDPASGELRQQHMEQETAEGEQQNGQAGAGNAARRSRVSAARGEQGSFAEKSDGSRAVDTVQEDRDEALLPPAASAMEEDAEALPAPGEPPAAEARRFIVAATDDDAAAAEEDAADETATEAEAPAAEPSDPGPPLPAPAEVERPAERPLEGAEPAPAGLDMQTAGAIETGDQTDIQREDLPQEALREATAHDNLAEEFGDAVERRVRVWFVFRVAPLLPAPDGPAPGGDGPAQPAAEPPGVPRSP